jgi:glutathionyl-hydroquinone reductase
MQLLPMLKNSTHFQELTKEQQEILAILASQFEEHSEHTLHLSPTELADTLSIGNKKQWHDFLNLEPTQQYIKTQQAFNARIAQRKAFQALEREANEGNVNAAKQINELSGILNNIDTNKIIVLHHINRIAGE